MTEVNSAQQGSAAGASLKWKEMGFGGKIVFVGKLAIWLCTFGFAFPLLLNDV